MRPVSELELPVYDYTDERVVGSRFHEVMRGLRAQGWLAAAEPLGYVILDHAGVDQVLRTRHARMPAIEILELQGVAAGPMHDQLSGNLNNLQGEEHRRLRAQVQAPFLPKATEPLRPVMRAHVADLFGAVTEAGECEFVSAVAKPYPARMIAEIVGRRSATRSVSASGPTGSSRASTRSRSRRGSSASTEPPPSSTPTAEGCSPNPERRAMRICLRGFGQRRTPASSQRPSASTS